MAILVRLLIVSAIATLMAIVGMELIMVRDGRHVDWNTLSQVVPRSILLWVVFSFMLSVRPALTGVYIGVLSPFLGALMFLHPLAIVMVLTNLVLCLGVGVTTGALVSWVSRHERLNS